MSWDLAIGMMVAESARRHAEHREDLLRTFPEQAETLKAQWARADDEANTERRHRELVRAQEEIARSIRWSAIFK